MSVYFAIETFSANKTKSTIRGEIHLPAMKDQALYQLYHLFASQKYVDLPKSVIPDAESECGKNTAQSFAPLSDKITGPVTATYMHLELYIQGKTWKFEALQEAALKSFAKIFTDVSANPTMKDTMIGVIRQASRSLKISDTVHQLILNLCPTHRLCLDDPTEYDNVLKECYGSIPNIAKLLNKALGYRDATNDDSSRTPIDFHVISKQKKELESTENQLEMVRNDLKTSRQLHSTDQSELTANKKQLEKMTTDLRLAAVIELANNSNINAELESARGQLDKVNAELISAREVVNNSIDETKYEEMGKKHEKVTSELKVAREMFRNFNDKSDLEASKKHVLKLEAELKKMNETNATLSQEEEKVRVALLKIKAELKLAQETAANTQQASKIEVSSDSEQLRQLQEQIKVLSDVNASIPLLEDQAKTLATANESIKHERDSLRSEFNNVSAQLKLAQEAAIEAKAISQAGADKNNAQLASTQAQIDDLLDTVTNLKEQNVSLKKELEAVKERYAASNMGQLKAELEHKIIELEIIKKNLDDNVSKMADSEICKRKLRGCEADLHSSQLAVESLNSRVEELEVCETNLKTTEKELQDLKTRFDKAQKHITEAEGIQIRLDRSLHGLAAASKEISQKDREIQALSKCKDKLFQTEAEVGEVKANLVGLQDQVSEMITRKEKLHMVEEALESAKSTIADQKANIFELDDPKDQLTKALSELDMTKTSNVELTQTVSILNEENRDKTAELSVRQSELIEALKDCRIIQKNVNQSKTEKVVYQTKYNETRKLLREATNERDNVLQQVEEIATEVGTALETLPTSTEELFRLTAQEVRRKAGEVGRRLTETHSKLLAIKPFAGFDDTQIGHNGLAEREERTQALTGTTNNNAVPNTSDPSTSTPPDLLPDRNSELEQEVTKLTEEVGKLKIECERLQGEDMSSVKNERDNLQKALNRIRVSYETVKQQSSMQADELKTSKKDAQVTGAALDEVRQQLTTTEAILKQMTHLKNVAEADIQSVKDNLRRESRQVIQLQNTVVVGQKTLNETKATLLQAENKAKRLEQQLGREKNKSKGLEEGIRRAPSQNTNQLQVKLIKSDFDRAVNAFRHHQFCGECGSDFNVGLAHSAHREFGVVCRDCGERYLF